MRDVIAQLVAAGLDRLRAQGLLPPGAEPNLAISRTKDPSHGDFACALPLALGRRLGRAPREIAGQLVAALPESPLVDTVEIAGPGFVNFRVAPAAYHAAVAEILAAGERYGSSTLRAGRKVQVEFVSANPTGPLHVGHGRGAAYGAALANLLAAVGYAVEREYYVNDAGRQIDILTLSVWLRYLELAGGGPAPVPFPPNAYRGAYVRDIARDLLAAHGPRLGPPSPDLGVAGEAAGDDAEARLDALIRRARSQIGEADYRVLRDFALDAIRGEIEADLAEFGVRFDRWYSERSLLEGALAHAIEALRRNGATYEAEGAVWFRSSAFGDEKDRVLVRENGQSTYFASDVAYHLDKLERGFDELVDVWGADHHGYIARVKGALAGLGQDPERLRILLVQFANLWRGGEKLPMSTRSGEFVTLRALREEVGRDAARFFYVMRKSDQHLDFDLDLAKSRSNENPVYYVQYAHARVCSVERQLAAKGYAWDAESGGHHAHRLTEPAEVELLRVLTRLPEVVESAALAYEPHQVAFYLREVANAFHAYYNAHTFLLANDAELRAARVGLAMATRVVLRRGLDLLGVSAPEAM